MTKLQRARAILRGPIFTIQHGWALGRNIKASMALDGATAKWRRVCWRCAPGWGHNFGGNDRMLGHAPVPRPAARKGS